EPTYLPLLYSSSRLTLNVTRRDMVMAGYSPSVRLFEAAACGATLVSDMWPGLEDFFAVGKEILVPVNSRDVVHLLSGYEQRELCQIGLNAQQRVLQEHTNSHRAEQFEGHV